MTDKKDGGPAYPGIGEQGGHQVHKSGMSLRDYFAGQALVAHGGWLEKQPSNDPSVSWVVASRAYAIADAMIAERDKE